MAFVSDALSSSITSESAPFIQPIDYDSDMELFQVPLQRNPGSSPLKIPAQDPVPKAALKYYAMTTSIPARPPSEESLSTNSQPNLTSRDTSPHQKTASSPPSSTGNDDGNRPEDHDLHDEKHKHSNASDQKSKILKATQLHLTKAKARTVLTKQPKKLIVPLKADVCHRTDPDEIGPGSDDDDEDQFLRIHQWLEECQTTNISTHNHHGADENATTNNGRAILAGPHLLHPFLGPALLSPPPAEPRVYAINIHGTLAHHPTLDSPNRHHHDHWHQAKTHEQQAKELNKGFLFPFPSDKELDLLPPSDRNSAHQATHDSAYDRAREMEISLSEHISLCHPDVLLRGKSHWFISANLTEASHFRLADVARRSAEGFDALRRHHIEAVSASLYTTTTNSCTGICKPINNEMDGTGIEVVGDYTWGAVEDTEYGEGEVPVKRGSGRIPARRETEERRQRLMESQTAAELAELYRALAAVHTTFGEEMRVEREERTACGGEYEMGITVTGGVLGGDDEKERERGRGRYRDRFGGARERERDRDGSGMPVVRRRSMGNKIGSLRGRRRRRRIGS